MSAWERFIGVLGALVTIGGALLRIFGIDTFGLVQPHADEAIGVMLFFGGVMVGWFFRALYESKVSAPKAMRKEMAERIAALDFGDKALVASAYDNGNLRTSGSTSMLILDNERLREFLKRECSELGNERWHLADVARKAIDENPWCLDEYRAVMDRKHSERGYQVAHNDSELLEIITQQWKDADEDSTLL